MRDEDQGRAIAIDTLLAIGMFVIALGSVAVWEAAPDSTAKPIDTWGYVLMGLQTLPLIWRRRHTTIILAIIVVAFMIDRGLNYPSSWAFFGIAVAIYTVGAQLPPRRSLIVGGITLDIVLLWTTVGVFLQDVPPFALVSELAILGFPLLIGRESHHRQQMIVDLERRAMRAEHEREQRANEAVVSERIRIARELHDVVAHEITVMTLQSAGARRVLNADPQQAEAAMETAEAAGHRALTEVRRLLGMLRTNDPRANVPQPGMDSLGDLVKQMNDAGLPTTLVMTGDVRSLPIGVDLNAYRIIQESLTNALKHGGPGARAEIAVDFDTHTLAVEVSDDGRGAAAEHVESQRHGQGLVGMHERAALLDGSLHAGPRPGGGFRVSAKIPIPSA